MLHKIGIGIAYLLIMAMLMAIFTSPLWAEL